MIREVVFCMKEKIFYRQGNAATGDIIPFFDCGTFYLYYLHDFRDYEHRGEGIPWYLLKTKNFCSFEECGEAVSRGKPGEQDLFVFTGSVIKSGDVFHVFYTGHNPHKDLTGRPMQGVMHAVSRDGVRFEKTGDEILYAPAGYEPDDWRDPFVFWREDTQKWNMLLAAREEGKPRLRAGCTTLLTSSDLMHWQVEPPFWAPESYFTHECPDLFEWNGWWYLIFSEYNDKCRTRYRKAHSLDGPWLCPEDDVFDGRAYYAAKSVGDGKRRFLTGWIPTKAKDDHSGWDWGGSLAVHELFQKDNGDLKTAPVKEIEEHWQERVYSMPSAAVDGSERFGVRCLNYPMAESFRLRCKIRGKGARRFGIVLAYSEADGNGYTYYFEPGNRRFAFDHIPDEHWCINDFTSVERTVPDAAEHVLTILVEDEVCVAYVDGAVALCSRMKNRRGNCIALLALDGAAEWSDIAVFE